MVNGVGKPEYVRFSFIKGILKCPLSTNFPNVPVGMGISPPFVHCKVAARMCFRLQQAAKVDCIPEHLQAFHFPTGCSFSEKEGEEVVNPSS